jgi:serine/threonine-protein kinase
VLHRREDSLWATAQIEDEVWTRQHQSLSCVDERHPAHANPAKQYADRGVVMPPSRHGVNSSEATTRPGSAAVVPFDPSGGLLPQDIVITSAESRVQYQVSRLLGQGGFGQVYLARRLTRSQTIPSTVCIKVSERIDGWLREAYFGQVLDGHERAIRVYDQFPLLRADGQPLYCLALEYARHGDLSSFLERADRPWPETRARREIAGILEVLGRLHRGQMLHRDLTPLNVFVCDKHQLKLGDFGITRHQSDTRGITVRTMNALTAPSDILAGAVPKWQARDDVYQVGQLLGMLVKGDAQSRISTREVRQLVCSDHLKEIIYRCIGERRKRYETADELIDALRTRPATLRSGVLRTLKGVHLAFTGILSRTRKEAAHAARRAGAIIHSGPSVRTSVVVRGRPNVLQAAGKDAGVKLMEIKRLREKGHRITLLDEKRFWQLVGRSPKTRKPAVQN